MTAAAFDTLRAARDLEAAGFERRQAEAIATTINHSDEHTATKAGIKALEAGIKALEAGIKALGAGIKALGAGIKALGARVDAKLEALEGRIYRASWMQGAALATLIFAAKLS